MFYSESGDYQDNNKFNITDQEGYIIHGFFPFMSLGFKLTSILMIIMMASLVCVTIQKTRSLHRPHNMLVANVMVADIILALWNTIPAGTAIIGYVFGKNVTHCGLLNFAYYLVIAYHTTFVMIVIDKVIAIAFPLKYNQIIARYVVTGMICISWLSSVVVSFHTLFVPKDIELPEYGMCLLSRNDFFKAILTYIYPVFLEAVMTFALNLYLAIKLYQVFGQMYRVTRLLGATRQNETLQLKLRTINKRIEPMLTLPVILLGNLLISLAFIVICIPGQFMIIHHGTMEYFVNPNIIYLCLLLHPIVYGIYFKRIHEPMIKLVLSWYTRCRQAIAVITPQA